VLHLWVELSFKANTIIAVKTNNEVFNADEFVLATGAWTSHLAKLLKLNVPI
jgi:D-amino-acid dehydrogenase